jgi:sulfur carrier protein ThiS
MTKKQFLKLGTAILLVSHALTDTLLGSIEKPPSKLETAMRSVLGNKVTDFFPKDLETALPKEVAEELNFVMTKMLNSADPESLYNSKELNRPEGAKIEEHLEGNNFKIKILVVDENGNPVRNAPVQLTEILHHRNSKEFHEALVAVNFVPYKKKKITDEKGHCVFENMPRHGLIPLLYTLFRDGVLSKPNFRVRVRASGYEEGRKEFVNIDKQTIARSAYAMLFWVKGGGFIVGNENNKEKKIIKLAERITIPAENLGDGIEIKIILKKEKTKTDGKTENNKEPIQQ